jgi:Flp pilus assembly protein TadB
VVVAFQQVEEKFKAFACTFFFFTFILFLILLGVIIGIAIGSVVGAALLIILLVLCVNYSRNKRTQIMNRDLALALLK